MTSHIVAGMAVEVTGDGTPVLCIHGLGGTSNTFTPQMPVLSGMRAIRPDLPGSGRSAHAGAVSLSTLITHIVKLCETLNIKSAHFAGHSMGTIICQHLAAEHSQLVRSLTLLGALIEPAPAARETLKKRAETARGGGMADIADAVMSGGTSAETRLRNPAAAAFVRESVLRQSAEGYAQTCEALAGAHAANHSRIQCPVLIINGEEDQTAPPSVARELSAKISGAKAVILPRCGHWPTVEKPEEVNAELKRFL
jgi:pimeloyl-ACP methyl ester carboxylesterase